MSKQFQLEEDEALWRRHCTRASLELQTAQAALQNAEHDNRQLRDATAETQREQEARSSSSSLLRLLASYWWFWCFFA